MGRSTAHTCGQVRNHQTLTYSKQILMDKDYFHDVILGCDTSPLCCAVVAVFSSCVDIVL